MKITIKKASIHGKSNRRMVNPNWFTGKTWMKSISDVIGSEKHDMYHVHFESGARTKLHAHNGNQILIATAGKGSLEIFERIDDAPSKKTFAIKRTKSIKLAPGDAVHIPTDALHTHGSVDSEETFSHIAINVISAKKNSKYKTVWYESDFKRCVSGIVT